MKNRFSSIIAASLLLALCISSTIACQAAATSAKPKAVSDPRHLDAPTTLSGIYCQGWVRTWDDGSLNRIQLAADTTLQGMPLPKDTSLTFYRGGKQLWSVYLSKSMTIQGVPCNGGRGKSSSVTEFYPSGKLKVTFLSEPVTIQGLPCKKSGLCPVYFFENGKIRQCALDKATEVGGKLYPKDRILHFDETGKVTKDEPIPSTLDWLGDIFSHRSANP